MALQTLCGLHFPSSPLPEQKHTLLRLRYLWKGSLSDSLTWGQSASRLKWGVLFLPAVRLIHLTASQNCTLWHSIKVLSLWWHFPVFPAQWNSSKKLLTVFKDTLDHTREPTYWTLTLAHPCVCSWYFTPVSLWPIPPLPAEIIFILWFTTNLNSLLYLRCHFWAMTLPSWVCIPFKWNEWHTNFTQEQLSMSFRAPALGFGGERSYSQVENPCSRDSITAVIYIIYRHRQQNTPPSLSSPYRNILSHFHSTGWSIWEQVFICMLFYNRSSLWNCSISQTITTVTS